MLNKSNLAMLRQRLRTAIVAMGGRRVTITRPKLDANGVPEGEPKVIGCALGLRYERGTNATLIMDIPGMVARLDTPRILFAACGGDERKIKKGDIIAYGDEKWRVLSVGAYADLCLDAVVEAA